MTPQQAASLTQYSKPALLDLDKWVMNATPKELQEFMHWADTKSLWIERANAALRVRLADQAAQSANELIQHSEKLTTQTDILVTESKNLRKLTKWLVWLTVVLSLLTVGLLILTAGLLYIDWHREILK